ncbi:hypothetical protein AALP_AA5G266200 [Arabis alpina]|uniref:J domain-containing protein n=1 Tax=Arabis alpina TaxID=50452 RepID=A0A087GZJ4_ARAAL|nr:hypothetical protein AALP_AA5G266200 [Arabis alpina]
MDDFTGLLARDFGMKPQGKSAPMAPQSNSSAADFSSFASSYSFANASSRNKSDSSPVFDDPGRDSDDLLFNDVFSGPPKYGSSDSPSPSAPAFDYDAMFKERTAPKSMPVYDKPVFDEDVYEAIPELKIPSTSQSARFDDVFSSPSKHRKQNSSPLDDLMGNLGKPSKPESEREDKGSSVFDDLIPGFGRTSSPPTKRAAVGKASDARERTERAAVQRAHAEARERAAAGAREKAEKAAAEARERANAEAREKEARVRAERAAVERAAAEARGRAAAQAKAKQQENNNDLESFFNSVSRPSSAPRQRTNPSDPFQDSWNKGGSFESSRASSLVPPGASENLRKASSATNIVDDISSIFGGGSATQSGGFPDVEGETEERRRARLERHQRTQERAAKALAEKNERDLQVQRDQAERNRIGETLDVEIKRWGAGKEGNLRALLSTLQYVLWPECGWQPVSLTDLIMGASVKKVYRKATLCIHPDKVQQKGANLQQKYIAEKVFDMLKEAWNKFNSEELF